MRSEKGRTWARVLFGLGALALVLVSVVIWWHRVSKPAPRGATPTSETAANTVRVVPADAPRADSGPSDEVNQPLSPLPQSLAWQEAFDNLPPAKRANWLRRWWAEAHAGRGDAELRDWLLAFLSSGVDLPTGLTFRVGPGGVLETATTLRVQVLDWLGEVDSTAAAAYAKNILVPTHPPDEWALALRNYGRVLNEPSQDAYYIDRVQALLRRSDWQAQPTGGFLEAFDAAVHSGSPEVVPDLLAASLNAPHAGTRKAATMALDNLAGDDPLAVARQLDTPDSPIAEMPTFRASLVSRLDPRDDAQVAEIKRYLLGVPHGADELKVFASTFPNANDFASHYLLTHQPGRNLYEIARVDLAAYKLVHAWQADPAFAPRRDTLAQMETRLRRFLESAVKGGMLEPEDLP